MSISVTFYNHAKKSNSTKVPVSTGTSFDCLLKAPCGILNPVIELELPMATTPLWNYAYISDFNRYYWVTEWTYSGRLWIANLSVDVLGSYKSAIGTASFYVLRAANEQDERIADTNWPITTQQDKDIVSGSQWFGNVDAVSSGCFIVGLRGRINADQTAGGITYLAMTPAQFKTFTEDLFNDQLNNYIAGGALDIGNSLALMIFNPTQYIASCLWLPAAPTSETPATGFNVGWWGFTTGAKIVSSMDALIYTASLSLTSHPYAATRGRYMNAAPFTSRSVFLPRYGLVDLTNAIPANADTLNINLTVDPISGQGLYHLAYELIGEATEVTIDEIQCQIGVEMPLSSNQITIQEAAGSVTSAAAAAVDLAEFNPLGMIANVASAMSILQPHLNDISGASGFLGYSNSAGTPFIVSRFMQTADMDVAEEGKPLCKIRTPSTLNGYMKVLHGDMAIAAANETELEMIRNYLESGFYYE